MDAAPAPGADNGVSSSQPGGVGVARQPKNQSAGTALAVVPPERVERRILLIRGQRVLLSGDLPDLYEVEPRALVQAVKRDQRRFPDDLMFQLTPEEWRSLKSQFVISSWAAIARGPTPLPSRASRCCRACCTASGAFWSTWRSCGCLSGCADSWRQTTASGAPATAFKQWAPTTEWRNTAQEQWHPATFYLGYVLFRTLGLLYRHYHRRFPWQF